MNGTTNVEISDRGWDRTQLLGSNGWPFSFPSCGKISLKDISNAASKTFEQIPASLRQCADGTKQKLSDAKVLALNTVYHIQKLAIAFFQAAVNFVKAMAEKAMKTTKSGWAAAKQGLREAGPRTRDAAYRLGGFILQKAVSIPIFADRKVKESGEAIQGAVQTLWNRIKLGFDSLDASARDTARRLGRIALTTLKAFGIFILFAAQSTLFSLGFIGGIVFPQPIENATQRIFEAWNHQSWLVRGIICTGAVVAWPISLAAAAFFVGGNTGLACLPSRVESSENLANLCP